MFLHVPDQITEFAGRVLKWTVRGVSHKLAGVCLKDQRLFNF